MNARMAQNLRQAKMKERMQEKLRKKQEEEANPAEAPPLFDPSSMQHSKFSTGENVRKTPVNPDQPKRANNKKKKRKAPKK